jgi:hypothetical protein
MLSLVYLYNLSLKVHTFMVYRTNVRGYAMPQNDDAQADGYYAEDTAGADELDLSFLDEDESDEAPKKQ